MVPISSVALKPPDPNTAVVAAYGRGVWTYAFDKKINLPPLPPPPAPPSITQPYASYDFESGAQGWTSATPPIWSRGAPGEKNGADYPAGNGYAISALSYVDQMNAALVSPPVTTQAGTAVVQFALKLDTGPGYDGVDVEWSVKGTAWTTITTLSGRSSGWPAWENRAFAFTSPGGPVQVRFRFHSDELCSGAGGPLCSSTNGWDGLHIDNVVIGH
jgi:hypothetical protein